MKNNFFYSKLYFLISIILLSQSIQSQQDLTDTRKMDAMTDLKNRKARKADTPKDIKGTYYFNKNFQLSRIVYFGEELKEKAYLRYNAANDEIEMGNSSTQKDAEEILLKSAKVHAIIDNEEYRLLPHRLNETNYPVIGYLVVLVDNPKHSLYIKRTKVFMKAVEARTSLDRSFPARFVDEISYYFSSKGDTPIPLKTNKSSIIKISGENGSKVRGYIKENEIKTKSLEGLVKIFDYINSL